MRAVKRQSNYSDSEATDIKRFTRQNVSCSHSEQLCLFCEKPATRFKVFMRLQHLNWIVESDSAP